MVLVPLLLLVLFSEPLYRAVSTPPLESFLREQKILDSLELVLNSKSERSQQKRKSNERFQLEESPLIHLHSFDPNTSTIEDLLTLGFDKRVAARVVHYKEKGGSFWKKEDLLRIYGMDSAFYTSIASYVVIPEKSFAHTPTNSQSDFKPKSFASVDINLADTTQLKRIKGIGSVLANRIVRFREKLGGFISINQLKEVYGLDTLVIQESSRHLYLAHDFNPHTININSCSEKELAAHPYISNAIAKAVVTYRFQHGSFSKVEDIEQVKLLDRKTYSKIAPYLAVIIEQQSDMNTRE